MMPSPLLLGHPFVLGKYHQEILATWIAMKLLVCEYSVPEDVVTPSLDRSLVMGRRLPPDIMKKLDRLLSRIILAKRL
jgi:hypothetical protein